MTKHQDKVGMTAEHATAYSKMLERVKKGLENTEDDVVIRLQYVLDNAKEKAYEMGELSREEAEKIGTYLKRDMEDAASYLAEEGRQFTDWLKFDVELVEDRLADLFVSALEHATNPTNLELQKLAEEAATENLWYTGEISGPGTLVCDNCGHEINIYHIQDIPGCPKCDNTVFRRVSAE